MHIALFKVENFSHFVEKRERERERKISNKDINKTDQKRLKESESRKDPLLCMPPCPAGLMPTINVDCSNMREGEDIVQCLTN
jgi:hypothetical protein